MKILAGNKYNLLTWALSTTAKTLTVSNAIGFDFEVTSLDSIYDTTTSSYIPVGKNVLSCAFSYVSGLPTWVFTFATIPAGVANADILVILLEIPQPMAVYTLNAYQASKV